MSPLILGAALLEGLSLTLIQGYLPLYLRRALGEPSFLTVALVLAVPALGTMVASNFLGGLSDVSGRLKPMILLGLAGYAAALGVIPAFRHGFGILAYVGLASLFYGTLAPSPPPGRPDRLAKGRGREAEDSNWKKCALMGGTDRWYSCSLDPRGAGPCAAGPTSCFPRT